MSKMICPECGREFDEMEYVIGENGNTIVQSVQKKKRIMKKIKK